jgi:tripartite-type tricarboxylate transporter receptor subunit TctC
MSFRTACGAAACAVLITLAPAARAQDWPNRSVLTISPLTAGNAADTVARIVTPKLQEALGQQWVVDNRGGAAGNIATEIVARAMPDGYTVLMGFSTTLTVNPILYKLPFDVMKDLQPVIMLAAGPYMLVVHSSVAANSVRELIELAKSRPRKFNYASSGTGSPHHLAAELFKSRAGIDMVHVPYKGGGPAAGAVLSGEVEVLFGSLPSVVPHMKSGRIKPLAVTGLKRARVAPEVPTIAESGFPNFDVTSWYGLLLPAHTPETIAGAIFKAASGALKAADVQEGMARQGLEVAGTGPKAFTAQIRSESETWATVIKDAGIRAE